MKRYVKSASNDMFYEIREDATQLISKLEMYKDFLISQYGEGTASYVDDAISSIESSINRIRTAIKSKKIKSATNTCGIGAKPRILDNDDEY